MTAESIPVAPALVGVPWEQGASKPDVILTASGVRRTFGGLTAVDVDHLEVQRGVITALIGPNGAGKTTFFNLLTNFDKPDTGSRNFEGRDLDGVAAHRVANLGMVRTFQLTKALSKMTVIENMLLGATGQAGEKLSRSLFPPMWRGQERANTERADELLARFKLDHMREEFAGTLSGGQRKLLEMARALARASAEKKPMEDRIATEIFRRVLTRPPRSAELTALTTYYHNQLRRLRDGELEAAKICADQKATDEHAAWTLLARVVMNVDEAVTKP